MLDGHDQNNVSSCYCLPRGWGIFSFKDGSSALMSDGRVLAGCAALLVLPKEGAAVSCLTNTASEAMDDLAFQLAGLFSSSLLTNLEATRKEVEEAETSHPFSRR